MQLSIQRQLPFNVFGSQTIKKPSRPIEYSSRFCIKPSPSRSRSKLVPTPPSTQQLRHVFATTRNRHEHMGNFGPRKARQAL
ncbi:hypothetical protein CDV36_010399 [Fusarium kuroshium]|uniref:Uncharacterized protein n=2 Tax=Fusarium solani species complex TaxID=232080 RepID=A0A3M2RXG8_9HYPO|nr:hypothetical protein CDV36_010399 [Fusarium kuroshium]RSL87932.1 hypothetical protein CEP51_001987 [Fusarium floridanum]